MKKIILSSLILYLLSVNIYSQDMYIEVVSYGFNYDFLNTHNGFKLAPSHNISAGFDGYMIDIGFGYNDFTDIVSLGVRPVNSNIYTGSQGGKYYINKNGNKTYIDRNTNVNREAEVFDVKSSYYDTFSFGIYKKFLINNFIIGPYLGYNIINFELTQYSNDSLSGFTPTKSGMIFGGVTGYSFRVMGESVGVQSFIDLFIKVTNYNIGINAAFKINL